MDGRKHRGRAEELGLEGFLVKPIDKSILLDTIMGVVDQEIEHPRDRAEDR